MCLLQVYSRRGLLCPLQTGLTYCENNIFVAHPPLTWPAACLSHNLRLVCTGLVAIAAGHWTGRALHCTDWLPVTLASEGSLGREHLMSLPDHWSAQIWLSLLG